MQGKIQAQVTESKSKKIEIIPTKDSDKVIVKETVITEISEKLIDYGKYSKEINHYGRHKDVISEKVMTRKEYAEKLASGEFKKDMGKYIGDSDQRIGGVTRTCAIIGKTIKTNSWTATVYAQEAVKGKNMGLAGLPKTFDGVGFGPKNHYRKFEDGNKLRQDRVIMGGVETLRIAKTYRDAGLKPSVVALTIASTAAPISDKLTVKDWSTLANKIANVCADVAQKMPPNEAQELRDEAKDTMDMFSQNDLGETCVTPGREKDFEALNEASTIARTAETTTPETNPKTLSGDDIAPSIREENRQKIDEIKKAVDLNWAKGAAAREPFGGIRTQDSKGNLLDNTPVIKNAGIYNGFENLKAGHDFKNKDGNLQFHIDTIRYPNESPMATSKAYFEKIVYCGINNPRYQNSDKNIFLVDVGNKFNREDKNTLNLSERKEIASSVATNMKSMLNAYLNEKFPDPETRKVYEDSIVIKVDREMK